MGLMRASGVGAGDEGGSVGTAEVPGGTHGCDDDGEEFCLRRCFLSVLRSDMLSSRGSGRPRRCVGVSWTEMIELRGHVGVSS